MNTHDTDFYTWTQQQAAILRRGCLAEADLEHLIEELDSMGASERRELENRLAVLLAHLLKWQYQPALQGKSWRATIKEQRLRVRRLLQQNPGLKPILEDSVLHAYNYALQIAVKETNLDETTFPQVCLWTPAQILDDTFWPTDQDAV